MTFFKHILRVQCYAASWGGQIKMNQIKIPIFKEKRKKDIYLSVHN